MLQQKRLGPERIRKTTSVFFLLIAFSLYANIGLRIPTEDVPLTSPLKPPTSYTFSVADSLDAIPVMYPRSIVHQVQIDSTGESVTSTFRLGTYDIYYPNTLSFDKYLIQRSNLETYRTWREYARQSVTKKAKRRSGGLGLLIETPKIKSKTFRRIFGGETLSLKVTGEITIDGNMRREKKEKEIKSALNRGPNTNFQMKQTQRFKVSGKVGENVTVNVDQDSERPFEFENAMKIKYSSDEDGIIQSIEAGNISLSLPSTKFVTASQSSAGLFGIKTKMKVGPLDITAIASVEKGEKKKKTFEGGAEKSERQIRDYEYKKNTYFFIDLLYRSYFKEYYKKNSGNWSYPPSVTDPTDIEEIEVYLNTNNENELGVLPKRAWAVTNIDSAAKDTLSTPDDVNTFRRYFKKLEYPKDYQYEKKMGYIKLNTPLYGNDQILAVAYKTTNGTQIGTFERDTTDGYHYLLKVLKPKFPDPSHKTWDLEWKNVYNLGGTNINREGFELKVFYEDPDRGEPVESNGDKGFLEIFGLDLKKSDGTAGSDAVIDNNENLLNLARGELIFPDLEPFAPGDSSNFPLPEGIEPVNAIYDTTDDTEQRKQSRFFIQVNSASRDPNISLGINIIPNSEEITLNGRRLEKDKDYIIDYFSGQLTLIDPMATDPNAKLDIDYESQQLFSIDKKTMIGTRAEYTLWERGSQRSFIGGTFVYYKEQTMDQKIRLSGRDQGPFSNMIWDLNGAVHLQPNFITKAFEYIPFIHATGPSVIDVEGEVAQILPNPNPLNNDATGDKNGVAYIDDFEAAERKTSLGVIFKQWQEATVPENTDKSLYNKGAFYWYNPFNPVKSTDVWPDKEISTQFGGRNQVEVLKLRMQPKPVPDDTSDMLYNTNYDPLDSWCGIQKGLSSGYYDQTKTRFLDIWVQGNVGRVHVDIGQISEDVISNNGKWDNEDIAIGTRIRNDILESSGDKDDEDEDTGIDGVFGADPPTLFYPHKEMIIVNRKAVSPDGDEAYDFWDLNGDKQKQQNEPWSYDDFKYDQTSDHNPQTNGTEGNAGFDLTQYPDSEDLNHNKNVDLIDSYFSYSFSLDKDDPSAEFIVGGHDGTHENVTEGSLSEALGWYLYRIPLKDTLAAIYNGKTGNPKWNQIESIRIWVDEIDTTALKTEAGDLNAEYLRDKKNDLYVTISIAEINFIGNEWELRGTYKTEAAVAWGDSSKGYPIKQIVDVDEEDDQTMVIEVINTHDNPDDYNPPPGVSGEYDKVQRITAKEQSLVLKFNELRPNYTAIAEKTLFNNLNLIHYKRMKMFIYGGEGVTVGDRDSLEFFIRMGTGSDFNRHYYEIRVPKIEPDWHNNSINVAFESLNQLKLALQEEQTENAETDELSMLLENGQIVYINGKPSLRNIKYLLIGVTNKGNTQFTGEIWLNELRVSDVEKEKAMAMRVSGRVQLSDFISMNSSYEKKDADFHNVKQRFGEGANSSNFSFSSNVALNKLLPTSWGVSLPVSVNYSKSESTPKYIAGSDIKITNKTAPKGSLVRKKNSNVNKRHGVSVSLSKGTKSRNFFMRYLVDPISIRGSYSYSAMNNSTIKNQESESETGSFSYSLNFSSKNFLQPLKFLGTSFIFRPLSETKFYYMPTNINYSMSGSSSQSNKVTYEGLTGGDSTASFSRSISSGYKPFTWLNITWNRAYKSNMKLTSSGDPRQDNVSLFTIFSEGFTIANPGFAQSKSQGFSSKFNPKLFKWLTSNASYNANYSWSDNVSQLTSGIGTNTSVKRTISLSSSFKPKDFVKIFERKGSGRTRTTSKRPAGKRPVIRQNEDPDENNENTEAKEEEPKEKRPFPLLKIFSWSGFVFSQLDPVSFSFNYGDGTSYRGIVDVFGESSVNPSLAYQFGFTDDPGVDQSEALATNFKTSNNNQSITLKSGFSITRQIKVSLSYNLTDNTNHSTQRSGNTSKAGFVTGKDNIIPIPTWSVSWRGLEKLPFVDKVMQSASLNHSYSGKSSESWTKTDLDTVRRITNQTKSSSFRPLIGLNMTFKNSITANIQYQKSIDYSTQGATSTERISSSTSVSAKYTRQGGISLPFLKGKLDNTIDFGLSFQSSVNKNIKEKTILSETSNWSLKPDINYSFSKTVRGGTYFEWGARTDARMGKTSIFAFGINARIVLSGN